MERNFAWVSLAHLSGEEGRAATAGGSLDPQGPIARSIEGVWWWLFWLGVAVYVVFLVALVVATMKPRGGRTEGKRSATLNPGWWTVGGGVLLPLIVLSLVYGVSFGSMMKLPSDLPDGALTIEVIGRQWWWEVRYPAQGIVSANEVRIPTGEPVALKVTSDDVIHSFWVPPLAGKIDALPGRVNGLVIEADEPGDYRGTCAEFCGLQHAKMGVVVKAADRAEFDTWLAGASEVASVPDSSDEMRGMEVFLSAGCPECHTIRGTQAAGGMGPDLTHFASRDSIGALTLPNTTGHLTEWIESPQDFKEGTQMEGASLGEEDLQALVTYLESLE